MKSHLKFNFISYLYHLSNLADIFLSSIFSTILYLYSIFSTVLYLPILTKQDKKNFLFNPTLHFRLMSLHHETLSHSLDSKTTSLYFHDAKFFPCKTCAKWFIIKCLYHHSIKAYIVVYFMFSVFN